MQLFKNVERFFARLRQRFILNRMLNKYGQKIIVEKFKQWRAESELNFIGKTSNIWVCWWQGEEQMPQIVQVCYRQIQKLSGTHPVILITDENYKNYVQLPTFIYEKYQKEIISKTHFSDIIRFYLLKEYGGIWMDITNFLTKEVDTFVPSESKFYSYRHITKYNNVSRGLWTSYFNASGKGNIIPTYLYESLVSYWSRTDTLIDYLMLDYIFKLGYDHIPAIKELIDELPLEVIGTMRKILNKKWNQQEWDSYYAQAGFQKLSYKKYVNKTTKMGEKTHYAYLVENY